MNNNFDKDNIELLLMKEQVKELTQELKHEKRLCAEIEFELIRKTEELTNIIKAKDVKIEALTSIIKRNFSNLWEAL